jgi:hypothetical protein
MASNLSQSIAPAAFFTFESIFDNSAPAPFHPISTLTALRVMRDRMIAFPQSLTTWYGSSWDSDGNACLTEHVAQICRGKVPMPVEPGHKNMTELFIAIGEAVGFAGGGVYHFLSTPSGQIELRRRLDHAIARLEEHQLGPVDEPKEPPVETPEEQPVEAELVCV